MAWPIARRPLAGSLMVLYACRYRFMGGHPDQMTKQRVFASVRKYCGVRGRWRRDCDAVSTCPGGKTEAGG